MDQVRQKAFEIGEITDSRIVVRVDFCGYYLTLIINCFGSIVMPVMRVTHIEPPSWARQPNIRISGVTPADYSAIQQHRHPMLEIVHQEIEAYLNDESLCFDGETDNFPYRPRLTGAYYIGSESYSAEPDDAWIQIGICCRCIERPKAGIEPEDDYLGLEVWLKCLPECWSFSVFRNTDSSAI